MRCSGSRNGLGSAEAVALNEPLTDGNRVPLCPPFGEMDPRPGSSRSRCPPFGDPWPERRKAPDLLAFRLASFTKTRGSVDFEREAGLYLPGTKILPSAELGRLDGFSNWVPLSESPPTVSPAMAIDSGAATT